MSIVKFFDDAKENYKAEIKIIREVETAFKIVFMFFETTDDLKENGDSIKDIIETIYITYYIYYTYIIEKLDDSNLTITSKVIVKGKLVAIGSLIGRITTHFDDLGLKYGIFEKFQEISEKKSLYYQCEKSVNNSILLTKLQNA